MRDKTTWRLQACLGAYLAFAAGMGWAQAEGDPRRNAGILAYACVQGEAQYLFAQNSHDDEWSSPGGRPLRPDRPHDPRTCKNAEDHCEPPLATALREFFEETKCAVSMGRGGRTEIRGPWIREGRSPFLTYLMRIDFVAADDIRKDTRCHTVEKRDWAWVAHKEVRRIARDAASTVVAVDGRMLKILDNNVKSLAVAKDLVGDQDPCTPPTP